MSLSNGRPSSVPRRRSSVVAHRLLWALAYLFITIALLQLGLTNNTLTLFTFIPLLVLIGCGSIAAYSLNRLNRAKTLSGGRWSVVSCPDPILLPLTYFLAGLGLVLTARLAPSSFIVRQQFWLVIATALLLLVTLLPQNLNWLRRYKYTWLIGGLLLLSATLIFGVNPSGFGARLWLNIGSFYFQPSEPLKLLMIVFLAGYLADRRRQLVEIKAYVARIPLPHPAYFGPMLLMWGFSIVLLIWQRDLGAALLFFGTFLGMLYLATGEQRYVWVGLVLLVGAGILGYYLFDVVELRVDAFLNPWLDPAGRSFQIVQSLLAFASGGFLGQGLGQGLPTAIPVVHTDFVFAAIGEEFGLWGSTGVLLCFALLVGRAFFIAARARNGFEQLLAAGIGTMLGLQTVIIMAGTLKLLPLTGVTLPLVSYGGSSLVTSFVMVGLLLFIDQRSATTTVPRLPFLSFRPMPHYRLARGLMTGLLIVAGGLAFWQILAAPFLVDRDDNPRPIIAEQQIRRGRLLAADGTPIVETVAGDDGLTQRRYLYPDLSSVTGFYSIRYGAGGTEALFDPLLRGTANRSEESLRLDDLLHRPLAGEDVELTINLPAQLAADAALGNREGAVVIMELETGAIVVMSSHPTYDPNTLDEQWDSLRADARAPLLNRVTQGLFPVGDLARLIGLIGLVEAGATLPDDPRTAELSEMMQPLGESGYLATAHQLGLSQTVPGLLSQPGLLPNFEAQGTVRDLAITPLHLVRLAAALENAGRLPSPGLSADHQREAVSAMSSQAAWVGRGLLGQVSEQVVGLRGTATPKETGQASLSWFVGLAPTTASKIDSPNEANDLVLDPTQINPEPTPQAVVEPAPARLRPARYAVVAVVVTTEPDETIAFEIAKTALEVILP